MPIHPDEQARVDALLTRIRNGEPCNAAALRSALALLEMGFGTLTPPAMPTGRVWREDMPAQPVTLSGDWKHIRLPSGSSANPYGVDVESPAATPAATPAEPTLASLYSDT